MAGEPVRWAEIDAFAGGGGCGDVCGGRRTLSANAHSLSSNRLQSPSAMVARNRWTDSGTEASTDFVTVERAGPGWRPTGRARSGGGVQRSRSVEGAGMATEFAGDAGSSEANQRHVVVKAASRDDSWEALEQQCRRMEAVGLRIDNIDLTCLDADPTPHSPQSAQSARSARSLALARLSAATADAPANGPDGAPEVGKTREESWRAPTGERKSEWGEAAEGQEAGEGAHVKYAFSLVPTPRAKRDENPQWSDDSVQLQHFEGSDLPRPRAPSLDGGADVAESEGSLDFAAIFPNGTRDRVTLPTDAPPPSAPPALVSAAGSIHKGGNALASPCAPVLLPGVIYSTNTECTPGSLGQALPIPVQIVSSDVTSTTQSAAMGQFSHGPPDSMHQALFRSPHSSTHSSPYSSLSILPPSSSTDSYYHTGPSRSAIPSQASYSPTSSTFHSFASPACASPACISPVCASPHCASPTSASPISATHAPPFPPTRPRPARQPARGVHRRSSSLSVLTENLPGVPPAACNSPCSSIRPARSHLSASTVVSRPSAEKPPTPRKALVAPRFARSPHEPSAAAGSGSPRLQHMQQLQQVQMQQQQIEQVQQMQHVQHYQQAPQVQHIQHVQQYQQGPQLQQMRPGRPRTPSMHRFTPSLPEISVTDAVEMGGEGSEEGREEGGDGGFSRSPIVAELPWRDGKGWHGAPMQAQRYGVPGHSGRVGSPAQAGRLGATVQVRRFSPGGGGSAVEGSGRAGAEIKVWETSERGLLQGKGRSISNRESGYRSMSSDNVLGDWSDIEADAEWVAVGGKQASARETGGLDGGGSPNLSGYGGIRGGAAAREDVRGGSVRGGSVRGQEEGVKSTKSVLKKMLWRFKSGPAAQAADESAKERIEQQEEEEEERQGEQEQEKRGVRTVRVFAVAEC